MELFSPEALRALLMSLLAGLSTLLGALIIIFAKTKSEKLVTASLGINSCWNRQICTS